MYIKEDHNSAVKKDNDFSCHLVKRTVHKNYNNCKLTKNTSGKSHIFMQVPTTCLTEIFKQLLKS